MLDFNLSDEQKMLVEMTKSFVEKDMMPHEEILESKGILPSDLAVVLKKMIRVSQKPKMWSKAEFHARNLI